MNRLFNIILALIFLTIGLWLVEYLWDILGIILIITPVTLFFMVAWHFLKKAFSESENE